MTRQIEGGGVNKQPTFVNVNRIIGHATHCCASSQPGKTQDDVTCICGSTKRVYRWSWAGHGKTRCDGCGRWIGYFALAIYARDENDFGEGWDKWLVTADNRARVDRKRNGLEATK